MSADLLFMRDCLSAIVRVLRWNTLCSVPSVPRCIWWVFPVFKWVNMVVNFDELFSGIIRCSWAHACSKCGEASVNADVLVVVDCPWIRRTKEVFLLHQGFFLSNNSDRLEIISLSCSKMLTFMSNASEIEGYKSTISNVRKDNELKLLNQWIMEWEFSHWFASLLAFILLFTSRTKTWPRTGDNTRKWLNNSDWKLLSSQLI